MRPNQAMFKRVENTSARYSNHRLTLCFGMPMDGMQTNQGGAVKLGKSGERGAAAPDPNTTVAEQDRGYLVADNLMTGSTQEFSSANPVRVASYLPFRFSSASSVMCCCTVQTTMSVACSAPLLAVWYCREAPKILTGMLCLLVHDVRRTDLCRVRGGHLPGAQHHPRHEVQRHLRRLGYEIEPFDPTSHNPQRHAACRTVVQGRKLLGFTTAGSGWC